MSDRVGQQLGNYLLVRLLGQGGYTEVYLGKHVYLHTFAALKLLQGKLSPQDIQTFTQEAQTIAALKHPHIVRFYDFGIEQMMPYIVMDYAPNGTLRERHPRGTIVPAQKLLSYVKQVGAALAYTHEHKLIHRDVKPENMLLDENKQVLLSDFGIVTIAHSTASMQKQNSIGTVHYMAPEQLRGYPTPASDQYSLGIVVYEWLCGARPFTGTSMIEIGMKHANDPVPSLRARVSQLPVDVERVVFKALAKNEKQRFPQIQDFVQALEEALTKSQQKPQSTFEKILQQPRLAFSVKDAPVQARKVTEKAFSNSKTEEKDEHQARLEDDRSGVRIQVQQQTEENDTIKSTAKIKSGLSMACFIDSLCVTITLSSLFQSWLVLGIGLLAAFTFTRITTIAVERDQSGLYNGIWSISAFLVFPIAWACVGWLCGLLFHALSIQIIFSLLGLVFGFLGYVFTTMVTTG